MSDESDEIDDRGFMPRKCFVIMPFGEKIDGAELVRAASESDRSSRVMLMPGAKIDRIHFDQIYTKLIEKAVSAAADQAKVPIECIRADKVNLSGHIHLDMLEHVVNDDIAIVDITTQNANVFYELGVRHSFRHSTTILIWRKGTQIPFNIGPMRGLDYDDSEVPDDDGVSPLEKSCERLTARIVASFKQKDNDSLVHNLLPNCRVVSDSWPIMEQRWVWYEMVDRKAALRKPAAAADAKGPKLVGFVTGDILNVREIDVWVNAENTKMQMARYHDGSISSNIRYYGARRNHAGHVEDDAIEHSLRRRMGQVPSVEPGVVIATPAGALTERNKVKLLMHVAALQGEPGRGYRPIGDYPGCVHRVLTEVDRLNRSPHVSTLAGGWRRREMPEGAELHGLGCKSVLFPLFGSRSPGQHPRSVAENLFRAAIVYFEQHPDTAIEEVYFLAFTVQDQELCERALGLMHSQNRLKPTELPTTAS